VDNLTTRRSYLCTARSVGDTRTGIGARLKMKRESSGKRRYPEVASPGPSSRAEMNILSIVGLKQGVSSKAF